jgi:hypothetical protein
MKTLFRKILLGGNEITEYSTVTTGGQIKENVFFETGEFTADISATHWVLCLDPVVFGVWLKNDGNTVIIGAGSKCRLYFCSSGAGDFTLARKNTIAVATLDYFDKIEEPDGTLYLLRLKQSRIYHVNFLKALVLFFKYYKKPKWPFSKYKSLIAAYSFPRRVRIISFKQRDYFNIFPMDLLGEMPQCNKYVFGLRHTNVTLAKIIEAQKIVVSEVSYIHKNVIYGLGKHHGGDPPSAESLAFKTHETENFGFFIPEWVDSYKEIQILETKNLGSHMLLWGEVVNEKTLKPSSGNLYHVHFLLYYHQKLKKAGYPLV